MKPYVFVAMPFRRELNFFFLYIKKHLEDTFVGLQVERGDAEILTRPLMDKIREHCGFHRHKSAQAVLRVDRHTGVAVAAEEPHTRTVRSP